MTNEEILANAPGWATMVCMERFWQKLTANSWRSIRLDLTYESLRIMPSANSGGIRSLSDIRRIVELEQKLEAAERDLQIFHGWIARAMMKGCCHEDITTDTLLEIQSKFAIEQRISGIQRVLDCRELNLSEGDVATISLMQEQLRQQLNGGE